MSDQFQSLLNSWVLVQEVAYKLFFAKCDCLDLLFLVVNQ